MSTCVSLIEYKECEFDCSAANGLDSFLKKNKLASVLKITPTGIKARNYVGVIKYKNFQFQIFPKLTGKPEKGNKNTSDNIIQETIINNLVFMLSYTKKLDIKSTVADVKSSKNVFLEILIREFATSLFDGLKRLTPKNYIREEENLRFLKGKIKFSENIKYNCTNKARFYCEFDEFSENNILNQLFLFVSTCLYKISENSKNKAILKSIINYFQDINLIKFDKYKVSKIKLTRNQKIFQKPFDLAKMFIENSSIDMSSNKLQNIALVFDMNKLFEEFVYEALIKVQNTFEIKAQKGRKLLKDDNSKKRNTFVDIFVKNPKVVIDTKYKEFLNADSFTNNDVFQVSTYCLLHEAKRAILVYPKHPNAKNLEIKQYCLNKENDDSYKIDFVTIDLCKKMNKNTLKDILKDLIDKLNEVKNAE